MLTWVLTIWKATYAQAVVGLALSLTPESKVSQWEAMQLAIEVHEECTAQGVSPTVALAVAMQESRFAADIESTTHDLGVFQVNYKNLFVKHRSYAAAAGPWDIKTYKGGVAAGCRAAAAWQKLKGKHWVRNYHCGTNGNLPHCYSYERDVLKWLSKGGRIS